MDRRTFLTTTATGAVAASAGLASADAAPGSVARDASTAVKPRADALRLRSALSPMFADPYLRDSAERFSRHVLEMSDGGIWLSFSDTAARGPAEAPAISEIAKAADFDAWLGVADELVTLSPAFGYFGGLPADLGLASETHRAWLAGAGGQMMWDLLADGFGLKPFAIGHTGSEAGAWISAMAGRDIVAPQDFSGASVSALGLAGVVAERLGAEVVALPPAMQATAMAEGSLALAEPGLPFVAAVSAGFGRGGSAHWLRSGLRPSGSVYCLAIRVDTWGRLTRGAQAVITAAAALAERETAAEIAAHQALVVQQLRGSLQIRAFTLPDSVTRAVRQASGQLVADIAGAGTASSRIHEAYFAFRHAATGLADPLRETSIAS